MHHPTGQVQNQPIQHVNRWIAGAGLEHEAEKAKFKGRNANGVVCTASRNAAKTNKQSYNRGKRDQSFSKNSKMLYSSDSLYFDKKVSMNNHSSSSASLLLNFHYSCPTSSFMHNNQSSNYKRKKMATFNKEVFLQSNCYFVVDNIPEKYLINGVDPDVLVAWESIRLVYLPTHEIPSCPICLFPPVAAKITRCGHVFCWSCILHYLQLVDKTWRKCPICHEAVHEADLKSVVNVVRKKFARHENITMKLMKRQKSSLFTSIQSDELMESNGSFSFWNGVFLRFGSRLMLTNKNSVVEKILLPEKKELENQLLDAIADETGEDCFIQSALRKIENEIEKLKVDHELNEPHEPLQVTQTTHDKSASVTCQERSLAFILSQAKIDDNDELPFPNLDCESQIKKSRIIENSNSVYELPIMNEECNDQMIKCTSLHDVNPYITHTDKQESQCVSNSYERFEGNDFYYFYQAEDGQNIYIDALNARCLIEEYGSLCNAPTIITGQILDFESFTMSLEHRKRFRYLSHLPVACEFFICELLLRPPVLSKNTIQNFMPEFNKRKTIRAKKLEEQRKFDQKASNARNKEFGYQTFDEFPSSTLDLTDPVDFPCSFSPTAELLSQNAFSNETIADESNTLSNTSMSFAQMLKVEQTKGGVTKFQQTNNNPLATKKNKDVLTRNLPALQENETDCSEVLNPTFKEMFNAAILAAPLKGLNVVQGKSVKKGKQKGVLLFATGAQRKY